MVQSKLTVKTARVVKDAGLIVLEHCGVSADPNVERTAHERVDVELGVVCRIDVGQARWVGERGGLYLAPRSFGNVGIVCEEHGLDLAGDHPLGEDVIIPATVAAITHRVAGYNLLLRKLNQTVVRVGQVVGDLHDRRIGESPARTAVALVGDRQLSAKVFRIVARVAPVEINLSLASAELVAGAHTTLGAAVALLSRRESLG